MAGESSRFGHEKRVPLSSSQISQAFTIQEKILTKTGFVIEKRIGEMKVSVILSIVELHGHRVVSVLIHRPHAAGEVQTYPRQSSFLDHTSQTDRDISGFPATAYCPVE